jgi:hypothetical protein
MPKGAQAFVTPVGAGRDEDVACPHCWREVDNNGGVIDTERVLSFGLSMYPGQYDETEWTITATVFVDGSVSVDAYGTHRGDWGPTVLEELDVAMTTASPHLSVASIRDTIQSRLEP